MTSGSPSRLDSRIRIAHPVTPAYRPLMGWTLVTAGALIPRQFVRDQDGHLVRLNEVTAEAGLTHLRGVRDDGDSYRLDVPDDELVANLDVDALEQLDAQNRQRR